MFLIFSLLWPLNSEPEPGDPYIIINKQTNHLVYIEDGEIGNPYPVGTGKKQDMTPEGEFTVVVKAVRPYYRKLNIAGGDPKNPLGSRWIGFDADETNGRIYGIHGTNRPESIGHYVSQGCVRMRNEEVDELFERVKEGTKVLIVNENKSFAALAAERHLIPSEKPYYLEEDLGHL
ncbi:L,D-transpeptidase [Alteribacillus sp. HJP-4]|uniref:L,D-transpeptidase n=1 Tax=Alteribacillus sp. HJP-4 TaxID=2775394 RepID=UPI0035CCEBCE